MKKTLSILLASTLLTIPTLAEEVAISKDSPTITLSKEIVYSNDREPLVPLRQVSDALGMTLKWDAVNGVAILSDGPLSTTLTPNQSLYTLSNYTTLEMDVPATLHKGSLYVPASFFAQSYDYLVQSIDSKILIATENTNKIYDDIIMPLHEGQNSYYVNQTVGINLEENPSTGYMWQVNFPAHIKIISNDFSSNNTDLVGAPGTHHWLLKATKPGTYTLTFSKMRQGNKTPVETKTFILNATEFVIPK